MFRQGGDWSVQFPDARGGFLGWINLPPPPVELKLNIFKNGKLKAKRQTKVKKSQTVFRISENKKDGIQWFQVHLLLKFVCSNSNCVIFVVLGGLPRDNFPSGNFPNVKFPKRQLLKG